MADEQRNYESRFWGLIYDQMMERALGQWLERSRSFYAAGLAHARGPVLECACGTGLILLHLLDRGIDIYGFDISPAMLDQLKRKAPHAADRISEQALESFSFERRFEAVIVPSNSFAMLTTRDAQLSALDRIRRHLEPGGRLLMDIRLADADELAATAEGEEGRWHEWKHPESGDVIRQRIVALPHDFKRQRYRDRCEIEYRGEREEFPMEGRWIFEEEFVELLRSSGFSAWHGERDDWGRYWSIEAPGS